MNDSLTGYALKRPVTVIMVSLTVIGMGLIALYLIPLEFLPKIDAPFIGCYIPYVGATPAQVENEVAIPAEGEFRTISHVKRITTTSNSDGCFVRVAFDWGADMDVASSEVRDRMERLKLVLPDEIDRLMLRRFSSNSMPIMVLSLYGGSGDEEELAHLVQTVLQPRLLRIEGVAEVAVYTRAQKEVLIEFNQDELRSRNASMYDVVSRLQMASINIPVGELVEGNNKHYVRVEGEFSTAGQMGELIVGPSGLRLKDIANVDYSARQLDIDYSIDGKSGAFMIVRKESEANTVATCKALLEEIERAKRDPIFKGMESFIFFDQADVILAALNNLVASGRFGAVLAIVVLWLFLWKVRPTLVVTFAIPISLLCAFAYMFFAGMTMNIVTMISIIIAIGMLVDNSIVVLENIYRYQQLGYDPITSAYRGASEVGLAITASTLTSIVVFLPAMFMESGEMAVYMAQFAMPITVALLASLLVALTIIPLFTSTMKPREHLAVYRWSIGRMGSRSRDKTKLDAFVARARKYHPVRGIMTTYTYLLSLAIRKRFETFVLIVLVAVVTYVLPYRNVKVQEMPTVDTRSVDIEMQLEQNFDLDAANAQFDLIEGEINQYREELGIKNIWRRVEPFGGALTVYLYQTEDLPPGATLTYATQDVLNILVEKLPQRMPGVELRFSIPETGEGQARTITVMMRGDDADELDQHAQRFAKLMESELDGIRDVKPSTVQAKREVQLQIDAPLAERAGVSPLVIARTVDFALRGIRLPYLKQGGREIPVWAQFREEDRKSKANLDNVAVFTMRGGLMPLNQLVQESKSKSPQNIERVDGKNVINITGKTVGEDQDLALLMRDLRMLISKFELPRGYSITLGDELMDIDQNATSFITSMILAITLIYLVMGALFESFVLPLSILTTVPLAFIGVYWSMYLTGTPMDTLSYIGVILMVGVVVNNGIVLVDHINMLRLEGSNRFDAIIQAGKDRIRPVMMTALTTILGCVPMAVGSNMGAEVSFDSMGRALIGGLTTGTFLTLFVVPLCYTFVDDAQIWSLHFLGSLQGATDRRQEPKAKSVGE